MSQQVGSESAIEEPGRVESEHSGIPLANYADSVGASAR
jgi:hypothetical protein